MVPLFVKLEVHRIQKIHSVASSDKIGIRVKVTGDANLVISKPGSPEMTEVIGDDITHFNPVSEDVESELSDLLALVAIEDITLILPPFAFLITIRTSWTSHRKISVAEK